MKCTNDCEFFKNYFHEGYFMTVINNILLFSDLHFLSQYSVAYCVWKQIEEINTETVGYYRLAKSMIGP